MPAGNTQRIPARKGWSLLARMVATLTVVVEVAAMRRRLLLLVVPALICAGCAGVSAKEGGAATGTATVSPLDEACSTLRATVTPPCTGDSTPETASGPPPPPQLTVQAANESCLWYRGKIRWCLTATEGDEWWIGQYEGREHRGRYYVENHRDEVLGYLRPTSYGWRAMVGVCPKGPQPCGWARGGRVVRTGRRNVLHVYSKGNARGVQGCVFTRCDGKPRREVARGALAVEVAAFKFVLGDCREAWTKEPCRNGVGQ